VRTTPTAGGLTRSAGDQVAALIPPIALVIGLTFQPRGLRRMQSAAR